MENDQRLTPLPAISDLHPSHIDYTPGYAGFLVQRGMILGRLRGPDGVELAEKDFSRALALAPGNPSAHAAVAGALLGNTIALGDGVDSNDVSLQSSFPYEADPFSGFDNTKGQPYPTHP